MRILEYLQNNKDDVSLTLSFWALGLIFPQVIPFAIGWTLGHVLNVAYRGDK